MFSESAQEVWAMVVVGLTAVLFVWRWWRKARRPSRPCGGGCSCAAKPKAR